jgi:plastocyanin
LRLNFFRKTLVILLALFSLTACGDATLEEDLADSPTVVIIESTFQPESLSVSPGDVVYFFNEDSSAHRILSESTSNAFDDTGDFDSGDIQPNDVSLIEIPEEASVGTTFYFYCSYREDTMATPNGTLVVE